MFKVLDVVNNSDFLEVSEYGEGYRVLASGELEDGFYVRLTNVQLHALADYIKSEVPKPIPFKVDDLVRCPSGAVALVHTAEEDMSLIVTSVGARAWIANDRLQLIYRNES